MCATTSRRPTTARLDASTTVSTPAARRRGPVHPKKFVSGESRRSSSTTNKFSYFAVARMREEDLRQYLNDPIAAISPAIGAALPALGVILAPYLERGNGKGGDSVQFERPPDPRYVLCSRAELDDLTVL